MTLRRTLVFVAAAALVACGGDKKDGEGQGKTLDGVNKPTSGDPGGGGGAYAAGDTGPTKSLFGGRFKGIFKKNAAAAPAKKADLQTALDQQSAAPAMTPVAAAPAARAAAPTGSSEGVWAFAPANAAFGFVVADGGFQEVASALSGIKAAIEQRPGGAVIVQAIQSEMAEAGVDPFDLAGWAGKSGVDISMGMGMFASADGDVVVVLPVTDAAAFRKAIKDDNGDLGDKHCVMAKPGRYVCGEKLASAQAAAKPHDSPLAKRVARLPSWLRGDAEMIVHLASFEDAMKEMADLRQAMETIGVLAMAANLDGGALSVRGWLEGKRGGPVGNTFAAIPKAQLTGQSAGATNWFHFRLPMGLLAANIPAGQIPPPIKAGLIDNLTGEIVTYSRGKTFLAERVVFGLKDGSKTAPLVDMGCGEIAKMGVIKKLKQKPGACAGTVDVGKTLAEVDEIAPFVKGMPEIPVGVRVKGNSLELEVGWPAGPQGKAGSLASSGIARELVTGNWNAVFWGLAVDPLGAAPAVLQKRLIPVVKSMPGDVQMQASMARWVYGHMYDAGMAFALRDDGMYMMMEVSTFAGDPPAAYADHQKALALLVDNDIPGYKKQIKANAAAHRGTKTGNHAAAMQGGAPILGQMGVWGLLAGVGAWMNAGADDAMRAPPMPPR